MKKNIIFFFFFFFAIATFANNPQLLFEQANKIYRAGDYEKATALYEKNLKTGNKSAALYFNLGNAYYKQEQYAKAILNYERARKMTPQDDDILFNLKMANMNTVDKIEPVPQLFYEQWWYSFINIFDVDQWAKIALTILWVALVFAILYLFAGSIALRKLWFMSAALSLIGFFFLLFVCFSDNKQLNSNRAAIIVNPSAYIKSSPDDKSTNLFMLHAGTRIEILDQLQNWKKIKIANGNVGWISNDDLEII